MRGVTGSRRLLGRSASALVAAVVLVTASASSAFAAPKVSAEKKNTVKVIKQLMFQGDRALVKKDFAVALGKFRAADDAQPSPVARLGEARALVGLGQLAAAELMYNSVLHDASGKAIAHPPPGAVKEEEALALALPYVTLVVKGADPKTVTASIDGEVIPGSSWSVQHPVDPGAHFARAEAPGLETVETPFKAVEGEAQTVTLTFHGAAPTTSTTTLVGHEAARSDDSGKRTSHPLRTPGILVAGVGVAGLVFGGVMAGLAAKKHSSLATACPGSVCPQSESSDLSSYHALGTLSTVGLIAGGALAAGGIVLVVWPSKDTPKEGRGPESASAGGLHLSPILAPGVVGTAGQWAF